MPVTTCRLNLSVYEHHISATPKVLSLPSSALECSCTRLFFIPHELLQAAIEFAAIPRFVLHLVSSWNSAATCDMPPCFCCPLQEENYKLQGDLITLFRLSAASLLFVHGTLASSECSARDLSVNHQGHCSRQTSVSVCICTCLHPTLPDHIVSAHSPSLGSRFVQPERMFQTSRLWPRASCSCASDLQGSLEPKWSAGPVRLRALIPLYTSSAPSKSWPLYLHFYIPAVSV